MSNLRFIIRSSYLTLQILKNVIINHYNKSFLRKNKQSFQYQALMYFSFLVPWGFLEKSCVKKFIKNDK
jgi:hypothetical protein